MFSPPPESECATYTILETYDATKYKVKFRPAVFLGETAQTCEMSEVAGLVSPTIEAFFTGEFKEEFII